MNKQFTIKIKIDYYQSPYAVEEAIYNGLKRSIIDILKDTQGVEQWFVEKEGANHE